MRKLDDIACAQVTGAFAINHYQNYITVDLGPDDYFNHKGSKLEFGLDYNGIYGLFLWDMSYIGDVIAFSDIFTPNGFTIGDTTIIGTQGKNTFYTIYNP